MKTKSLFSVTECAQGHTHRRLNSWPGGHNRVSRWQQAPGNTSCWGPVLVRWVSKSAGGLVKAQLSSPLCRVPDSVGLWWAQDCVFLTSSQLMLVLLIQGPLFGNNCYSQQQLITALNGEVRWSELCAYCLFWPVWRANNSVRRCVRKGICGKRNWFKEWIYVQCEIWFKASHFSPIWQQGQRRMNHMTRVPYRRTKEHQKFFKLPDKPYHL